MKTRTEQKRRVGYRQIAATLINEIQSGVWQVNEPLPTELELVERFGVGRNTVRDALRELQDLGYLNRRRGTRSLLLRTSPDSSFVNSIRSVDELLEWVNSADNTLLSVDHVVLLADQAQLLNCEPQSKWIRLQRLRRRVPGEVPFCYSETYVDPKYGSALEHLTGRETTYSIIEKHCNVVLGRVIQEIEAACASENVASRLEMEAGGPILLARTQFYSVDGEVVQIGLAHFAPKRYSIRIALDRRRPRDADD